MATSGTSIYTQNRNEVITGALRKLAVLASGGTPSANQISDANAALNAMVKAFHADGMPLWKIKEYTFTVSPSTASYTVGPAQTFNINQPLKVIQAMYKQTGADFVPMNVYNHYDFNLLPSNNASGVPVNFYYHPLRTTGTVYLWPTPTSTDNTTQIKFVYQAPFEDMTTATDDFDFPNYWIEALIYNLAWRMAPEYGIPPTDRNILATEAKFFKTEALSFGSEEGSMFLMPDWSGDYQTNGRK